MPEVPLQASLFGDNLVDTRTRTQKKRDKQLQAPKQLTMFSTPEMAQFGVNPRPLLPMSPHTALRLLIQDPRTDEQRLQDELQAANNNTHSLLEQLEQAHVRAAWMMGAIYLVLKTQPLNEVALWTLCGFVTDWPTQFENMSVAKLYEVKRTPGGNRVRQLLIKPNAKKRQSR